MGCHVKFNKLFLVVRSSMGWYANLINNSSSFIASGSQQLWNLDPDFFNLEFFGPQMALANRVDAISQGPKKSRFHGPTCACYGAGRIKKHFARAV
jgi:hypothetical protein